MKKIFSSIVAVAMAAAALPASAGTVTLFSPKEGDVTNDGNFPNIVLDSGEGVANVETLDMVSQDGDTVACPIDYNWSAWMYIVDCSNVIKSGTWTLKIPENAFDGDYTDAVDFTWNYTNPTEGGDPVPLTFTAYAIVNDAAGTTHKAAPGESFELSEPFTNINIVPEDYGFAVSTKLLRITSDNGYDSEVPLNTMFYDNKYDKTIIAAVSELKITTSGTYTLHFPEGFLTKGARKSEAQDLSWTYTYKAGQGGGDVKDLVLKSLSVAGTDLVTDPNLAVIQSGTEVAVTIDPIADAEMVTVEFTDENGTVIRNIEIYEGPTKDDVVDRTAGTYKTTVGGLAVNKFFVGTEYTATVTAYSSTNAGNPANTVWGPVQVKFAGTTEPYKFSDVTVVSISPENKFDVIDPTQPIVITYSAPVASVKCEYSSGGQDAVQGTFEAKPNADKTIWTVTPGKYFWETSDTSWMFFFYAKDAEGRVVEGNSGEEAESCYQVTYDCVLAWPEATVLPGAGFVEEIYEFAATYETGINISWSATPYLIDADGNEVCRLDMNENAITLYDKDGKPFDENTPMNEIAMKMTCHLTEHVTTPGDYVMVFPRACFALGTESNGESNREMRIAYKVVEMPVVNVELENFGKASYKVPQGTSTTVALTPAKDWKVATLSLNGKDVTADIKDGSYTLKEVAEDASLIASFEYAEEVSIVETAGIVEVGDRTLTVTAGEEYITISGVVAGDNVAVYTMNGMVIGQITVTEGKDEIRISAPAGQVYLVKVNDSAVKVKH